MTNRFKKVKLENGRTYIFDTIIFQAYILILVLTVSSILFIKGFDLSNNLYVECKPGGMNAFYCDNPLYKNYKYCGSTWAGACDQELIPVGFKFGEPEPNYISYFSIFVLSFLIICFIINHYLYNKGKLRGIQ